MSEEFLEIETKYDASSIDRIAFKTLVEKFGRHTFRYAESRDIYYTKEGDEFLRYRMPSPTETDPKSELTFKKKHVEQNNNVRTEVNLRIDKNDLDTVKAFCEGIGYKFNFTIMKYCDIYVFNDANLAYYTVIDESGKVASFIEIEANEYRNPTPGEGVQLLYREGQPFAPRIRISREEGWSIVQSYEKLLAPIGISPQKRQKLSLFERYRKALPNG